MKRARGFTLIELVTVILVLALLAVFAVPRYLSVLGDARKSTVLGVEAVLQSAVALVKAKAKLDGKIRGQAGQTVTLEKGTGETVPVDITKELVPSGTETGIGKENNLGAIDLRDTQGKIIVSGSTGLYGSSFAMTYAAADAPGTCQTTYTEDTASGTVTIETDVTGC